jgi:hypothetical protein
MVECELVLLDLASQGLKAFEEVIRKKHIKDREK